MLNPFINIKLVGGGGLQSAVGCPKVNWLMMIFTKLVYLSSVISLKWQ